MRIGSSVQFTAGTEDAEKELQLWIYPTDNGDCLSAIQLYSGYIKVPHLSDHESANTYVIACLESLVKAIKTQALAGKEVTIEELMLAFNERNKD